MRVILKKTHEIDKDYYENDIEKDSYENEIWIKVQMRMRLKTQNEISYEPFQMI